MAYAPGVVDRSGEILAQSRLAGGMAALGGISQGIQTYQKNKLQNQVLSNENDSLIAGLQQLQQMGGGATMSNLAPAGMEKLIQKHLEGGGLNLSDSMKLNSMLNTTLKTAQVGQQMQAQQMQAQVNQQRLMNEIATGRQAQADVAGIGKVLQELSGQELTSDKVVAAAAKAGLSPGAVDTLTQSLGRLAPPKTPMGSTTQQLARSLKAARESELGRQLTPQEDAEVMVEAIGKTKQEPASAYETQASKRRADAAQDELDANKKQFSSQIAAEQSAILVTEGLNKGAKTGVFAPIATFFKRIAKESGVDVQGLDEQVLVEKGIAGLQASQISLLAKGLGSMSNADREFFQASFPSIKDSPEVNRYFAELAKENAKLAREDRAFVIAQERKGVEAAEINRLLDERRESRSVARGVYERMFGDKAVASASTAMPSSPSGVPASLRRKAGAANGDPLARANARLSQFGLPPITQPPAP